MKLFKYLFQQSWQRLLLVAVLSSIGGLSGAAIVAIIGKAITGNAPSSLALAFFAACLCSTVSRTLSDIVLVRVTQQSVLMMRIALSRRLLSTPVKKLQELGRNGLLIILTRDVDIFIGALPLLPLYFCNLVIIVSCLTYIAFLSWPLVLAFCVVVSCAIFAFELGRREPVRLMRLVSRQSEDLYGKFRNLIDGSKELQLNAERGRLYVDGVVGPAATLLKETFVKSISGFAWITSAGTTVFYIFIGLMLFVIPHMVSVSNTVLATATLGMMYLLRPIMELVASGPSMHSAGISIEKIQKLDQDLMAFEPAAPSLDPFCSSAPLRLQLRDVCHHYESEGEDRQFGLGPLNLTVQQGEILFIVGGNGSGKTTLAMLLLGLYMPESGHLILNGQEVDAANVEHYRRHFSAVFSDFHLFDQLLGEDQEALTYKAAGYIKALGMEHKVKVVDGKFSTLKLSSGQRKRLALVASYLDDRPVYLFDEWAADQDPAFKRVFYTELLPDLKARGKTVIAITHDDQYFSCADRVIKLADGQVQTDPQHPMAEPRPALHAL